MKQATHKAAAQTHAWNRRTAQELVNCTLGLDPLPGAELHSWGPGVSYRANVGTRSHGFSHFALWLLQLQQSPPAELSSGRLYLHAKTRKGRIDTKVVLLE